MKLDKQTLFIGKKFNKLTILSINREAKVIKFDCKCECGNFITASKYHILKSQTTSCGCYYNFTRFNRKTNKPRKDIKPAGESGFNYMLHVYKRNARLRNLAFDLSRDDFKILTAGSCHYCGVQPSSEYGPTNRINKKSLPYVCNGIDRIDNSIGYIKNNCVSCCSICNRAKGTQLYEQFITWIRRLKCQCK